MQLLIPFASPLSDAGRQALRELDLPGLQALLRTHAPVSRDDADALSLSPPHERVLAKALGLAGPDGGLPWAAHLASLAGLNTADLAWGLVTPVHWQVGADAVTLADPDLLELDDDASRALFESVHPLFEGEGMVLVWQSATSWLAAHESFKELPAASLDRAIGRNVMRWLAGTPLLQRLQMEVQMLLYTHPMNAEREARGLLPVNSFWLSGCGMHQPVREPEGSRIDDRLRRPALAEDWPAWRAAWRALDATLSPRLDAVTLCGERSAVRLEPRPRGLWERMTAGRAGRRALDLLESL